MRELLAEAHENNDRRARLAIEIFCYRARKYIGAFLAAVGGADAIVFTGGIGENSAEVRAKICSGLEWTGVKLNAESNAEHCNGCEGLITSDDSTVAVYVIPTDEELLIARDTVRCVTGAPQRY
jgi:acetate kinase